MTFIPQNPNGQTTSASSLPVVIASDQTPVSIRGNLGTATTASWTSVTALNTGLAVSVASFNAISVTLAPTTPFTTGAITFEVSPNSTNGTDGTWFAISMARIDSFNTESAYTIVANTNRAWTTSVDGFNYFRVRLSTVIAGAGVAVLNATPQTFAIEPMVTVGNATAANLQTTATQTGTWTVMPGNTANTTAWVTNPLTPAVALTGDTGAKIATGNGANQTNATSKGAHIILNLGAVTGTTPTLVLKIQGSADSGTTWFDVAGATTASLSATGVYGIIVYPGLFNIAGIATTATVAQTNATLPRTWRTVWTVGGTTPSFTITNVQVSYLI
jgi:hypothetical protein